MIEALAIELGGRLVDGVIEFEGAGDAEAFLALVAEELGIQSEPVLTLEEWLQAEGK